MPTEYRLRFKWGGKEGGSLAQKRTEFMVLSTLGGERYVVITEGTE